MVKHVETSLFNIELKTKTLLLHKTFLTTYKRNEKYPKGLNLKFKLALCTKDKQLQRKCEGILNRTSRKIQSKVIKLFNIELHNLWKQCKLIKIKLSEVLSQEEQRIIRTNVRRRIQIIEKNTKRIHQRKIERDNLCIENSNNKNKQNRRFSRKYYIEKRREGKKRVKLNRKERIRKAKAKDQNAINLSSKVLTTPRKSVLVKSPSFIATPNDVSWLSLRKELNRFINQRRYFAKNAFQKGQKELIQKHLEMPPKQRKRKLVLCTCQTNIK